MPGRRASSAPQEEALSVLPTDAAGAPGAHTPARGSPPQQPAGRVHRQADRQRGLPAQGPAPGRVRQPRVPAAGGGRRVRLVRGQQPLRQPHRCAWWWRQAGARMRWGQAQGAQQLRPAVERAVAGSGGGMAWAVSGCQALCTRPPLEHRPSVPASSRCLRARLPAPQAVTTRPCAVCRSRAAARSGTASTTNRWRAPRPPRHAPAAAPAAVPAAAAAAAAAHVPAAGPAAHI